MPTKLTWTDLLRIERAVWKVDTYVQALPGRSRRAIRRELRMNLRESAREMGAGEAIRRLGDLRRLSTGYLDAEYGDGGPRPQILTGVSWMVALSVVIVVATIVGFDSFMDGLEAGHPEPGTYTWQSAAWLGLDGEVTYDDQGFAGFRLSLSLLYALYFIAAFLLGSRLWRAIRPWWRRRNEKKLVRT